jgi:serine/threonine-protein kinase
VATLQGRYQLGARIGGGGMAEVFEGTLLGAEQFARPVAIKRMLPALCEDPSFGQMFINEARIASLLHHENIASVLDFDRDEHGRYFLVMELVRGVDLRRLMRTGRLPHAVSAHVVASILAGLNYAHTLERDGDNLGIVHRDVSPHNVMVAWTGAVKLVDFGIAKAVAATTSSLTDSFKGKLGYLSPEQAHGVELDGRSDVFAAGIILHELLCGQRLYQGATGPEILTALLTRKIPPPRSLAPDVPADIEAVCMHMLARDRRKRFASAHDALDALLSCSSHSARAGLELRQILRDRFPGEASARAESESGGFVSDATVPLLPSEVLEAPRRPAAEPDAAIDVAIEAPTRTARPRTPVGPGGPGVAPGYGPDYGQPYPGPHPRPGSYTGQYETHASHALLWIGGALLIGIAAIVATLLLTQ